MTLELII